MPSAPTSAPLQDATRTQREFVRECVEFFAEVVQLFGVPKSVGQIYGVLYASPLPLSFSDIVGQLEISKGSASQGLQLLRSLGAINVADPRLKSTSDRREAASGKQDPGQAPSASGALFLPSDGARREYYEPELSLRKLVGGVMRERIAPLAATSAGRLNRMRELAELHRDGTDFYLNRAKQLNTWRRRLNTVLPVLNTLLGPMSRK